jgi:phosphate acetyltransferase
MTLMAGVILRVLACDALVSSVTSGVTLFFSMVQSSDKRVLTAATQIVRKGLAQITLLGDPESVSQDADRLGLDLTGINVVDHMVRLHMHLAQIKQFVYIHMYPSLLVSEGSAVGMARGHALDHTVRPSDE